MKLKRMLVVWSLVIVASVVAFVALAAPKHERTRSKTTTVTERVLRIDATLGDDGKWAVSAIVAVDQGRNAPPKPLRVPLSPAAGFMAMLPFLADDALAALAGQ